MALATSIGRLGRATIAPGAVSRAGFALLGAFGCMVIGLGIAYLPWWLVLAVVLVPLVVVGGAVFPFPILMLALALVFQGIPGKFVPQVGSFRPHELIILYLVFVVVVRAAWRRESLIAPLGPFIWPLVYLYACVLVSAVYVKFFAPNPSLLSELRRYVTWLILPLLAYVVRTERQFRILMRFTAALAIAVALYVLAESMLHIELLENGTGVLDATNTDVTRSTAAGATYLMVFLLFWSINKMTAGTKWFPLLLVAAFISVGGLAVGFGRGVWIATAIGFIVATWLNRGFIGMLVSVLLGAITVAVLLMAFATVKPRVVEAMIDRASGVSDEIKSGGSFQWRQIENEYALAALKKRPFTGVGIGGEYKNRVSIESTFATETQYIHNSFMGLMVKLGIQAIIFPLWVIGLFFMHVARLRKVIPPGEKPLFGAISAAFLVPVVTSFTQPEWIAGSGIAALCVFIASLWLLERGLTGGKAPVEKRPLRMSGIAR